MPRTSLAVTDITKAGVAPTAEVNGDAVNGFQMPNDGRTCLLVRNANGSSTARTLTVRFARNVDGQVITPRTYSIPAGASRYIGPFETTIYGTTLAFDVDNAELKVNAYRLAG